MLMIKLDLNKLWLEEKSILTLNNTTTLTHFENHFIIILFL